MAKRTNTAVWEAKHNRWKINVQKDGTRRSFYSGTPGRTGQREANAKADAWLDEGITSDGVRVENAWTLYVDRLKESTSRSHYEQYASFGRVWVTPTIGRIKMTALNEDHLQMVIDRAFQAGRAHKTIHDIKTALSSFVKFARKRRMTTLLPEELRIPRGAKRTEKTILQPSDLTKLFTSSQTTYRKKVTEDSLIGAYRFQVLTGLRPGELLGIKAADIKGSEIHLQRSINRYGETTSGKNENAVRVIALQPSAIEIAQQQRRKNPFGRLFGEITQQVYRDAWARYRTHNGITQTTPYEIRHTFISIAKTLPAGQVKSIVGHSENMDTFGVYGHEIIGERERTAQTLQTIFEDILQSEKHEVC